MRPGGCQPGLSGLIVFTLVSLSNIKIGVDTLNVLVPTVGYNREGQWCYAICSHNVITNEQIQQLEGVGL